MSKRISKKSRERKHVKNSHLQESLSYLGGSNIPTSIKRMVYDQNSFKTEDVASVKILKDQSRSQVEWYKVVGISDIHFVTDLCKSLGVPRYDVKDMISGQQVSKVVEYENTTFILTSSCFINEENEIEVGQVAFILGDNFLVSFQESSYPIFNEVEEAIARSRVQIREKGADFLLYILLRCVHSLYSECIVKMSDEINGMEDLLIARESSGLNVMELIQARRHDYGIMKRCISPMRDEFRNILGNGSKLISSENMIYFNDFDDRLRTASEELEVFRDSIRSLMDLYFNNNNARLNEIMKRLTVVSTIFIPLTFMAGVWGMNFDIMPELKWKYGYLFSWATMAIVAIVAWLFLKRKKWF